MVSSGGTCRLFYGLCALMRSINTTSILRCGQAVGKAILTLDFNCSTRIAIFRNVRRMVSKVAALNRERFGTAPRIISSSQ